MYIYCILVMLVFAFGPRIAEPHEKTPGHTGGPQIQLVLSGIRSTVRAGDFPPRVRIEIRNNGNEDFILGEDLLPILNAPTYVQLKLTDGGGSIEPPVRMYVDQPLSAHNASWTRIAPGHYYGVEFDLDPQSYPMLNTPGQYTVSATYVSKGGNTPGSPDWDVPSFPVWEGTISSNSISLEILPSQKK